jgi:protease II
LPGDHRHGYVDLVALLRDGVIERLGHGTRVADPYRWLEDDNSPATAAWVEAENKVTLPYLEAIRSVSRCRSA